MEPAHPPADASPQPWRCLLVDDHAGIRGAVRRMLRQLGLDVAEAADGHEAMAQLMVGARVDVVLLDLHMPGADGFSVLDAIRRDPRLADLKVIVMTVDPRHTTMLDAAKHDGDRYLLKPVNEADLRAHLEAVLGPLA